MATRIFFIFTSLLAVTYCQTVSEWEIGQLPNPLTKPEECGRYANKNSFICDPNGILTRKEADHLDWILDAVYNNDTKCPCSAFDCETNKKGTIISLALVNNIKRSRSADNSDAAKLNDAKNFLFNLHKQQWSHGRCDNDVIILYVAGEKIIYTITGDTPKYKLTPTAIGDITRSYEHYILENEVAAALFHMIIDYRNVLRGEYFNRNDKSQEVIGSATQPVWSIASLLTILMGYFLSTRF